MHDETATATDPDEQVLAVVGALNGVYADSLLLVGRILGDRRDATSATVVGADLAGIDVRLTDPDGDHDVRIDFPEPATAESQVVDAAMALVVTARERSGEPGTTSAERVIAEMGGIRTMLTRVVRVVDEHPHLRRITFRGGDLDTFAPLGPDTFLYVLLPPPGRTELTIDQGFSWESVGDMPQDERPVGAYYSMREWRPDTKELDVLFVLHGDEGPASAWAQRAAPGDPVALWGPRTAYAPPPTTTEYLLVADETGLPATAAIIESLPLGTPVRVFAEVASMDQRQALPERDGVEVTWLDRAGAEPGTTSLLDDAVRAAAPPAPTAYVWGGAESRCITAVRRYVRREVGLPREQVSLTGYWRHRDHEDDAYFDEDA
ncbi:siderophore-interacting protein [Dermatobacter hominis]|uniref:siderophore-interacting protein n=1 Tax=Dermatobacter hominis TaxID=2884263 RepID=UPI001D12B020|nr:siderophore-interacting protein [Dermatobacter hominis]UDY35248.1 SIP domain-containing protein [Dermatobacter hominis]